MYEQVCYDNAYLKEVVVRVDFATPLATLGKTLPPKVGNVALKRFPVSEPRQALSQELQISSREVKHTREEFTEWNYYGREREKRLTLAPSCVFASYSRYQTFEILKADFLAILNAVFEAYPDTQGGRMGLRYINQFEHLDADALTWDKYVDGRLLGLFDRFRSERETITRVFHIVEFKYDDLQVKFQFGAPNPDFPAGIRRPVFVLDIDAYVQGLQDLKEIEANIERGHEKIQALFEQSITNELRSAMRAQGSQST